MSCCETETVIKKLVFYVDIERINQSGVTRFGPVSNREKGENLLAVLAGRNDVTKATLVSEEV